MAGERHPAQFACGRAPSTDSMHTSRKSPLMLQFSALRLLFLTFLASPGSGRIWPLIGYDACGSVALSGPWADGSPPKPAGVALDIDNDLFWTVSGGNLYKYRFSDSSVLSTYNLQSLGADMERNMLGVLGPGAVPGSSLTLTEVGQIGLTNGKDAAIYILSSDPVTHDIFPVETVELSFVPLSITYDAAFERFYATNALPTLSTADLSSVPPGASVVQIDPGQEAEPLFEVDYANLLAGNSISDIHFSPNTGTFFVLCRECNTVFELTKTGALRSLASSAFDIPAKPQAPAALSLARTGNVMLILRDEMVMDSFCQEFIPSLPVLPNTGPYFAANQTWHPIDSYVFCGLSQYEGIDADEVTDIVMDPSTSTNWLLVGGKLREYEWTGTLLRELDEARLAELGLTGITSMSYFKPRRLLLGLQAGNRVVVLDTAPVQFTPRFEDEEPPGPGGNAEFIQQTNAAKILEEYCIHDATLPSNSLGAIFYIPAEKAIIYSAVTRKSVFRAEFPFDQPGTVVVVGQSVDIEAVDDILYSPIQNSYLVWSNSGSKLVQVNIKPEVTEDEKSFFVGGDVAGMAMTPDGNIMILSTTSGGVNFFCGDGTVSSGVITRSLAGEDPDINPLYFWQLQQLQQAETGAIANVTDRSVPLGFTVEFGTEFGVECLDQPDLFVWPLPVTTSAECEEQCQDLLACNAYTWDFSLSRCTLKTSCDIQQSSSTSVSGVKQQTFFAPPPAAAAPPPPPPPPPTTAAGSFQLIPAVTCSDATLGVPFTAATPQVCQAACANTPGCGAFTFSSGCFLKTSCSDFTFVAGASSGIQQRAAVWEIRIQIGCKDKSLGPKISGVSRQECQNQCQDNFRCTAFTHNSRDDCFLKATCDDQRFTPGDVSGFKPPVAGALWEIKTQLGCKDPTLGRKIEAITQQACQDRCQTNPECNAFTHNSNGDCFLKATCKNQQVKQSDVTGLKPGAGDLVVPNSLLDSGIGASLVDGFEWDGKQNCKPWIKKCGLGANPGLKVGDITWYRMFAHKANPMKNLGDGTVQWTPYREKRSYGYMYTKGSEILGYFDPISVANKGDKAELTFLWASTGPVQDKICGGGVASDLDCDRCEDKYRDADGHEQYFYWESRCFSGTGDFRVALLDTSRGQRVTKDGYGYFNPKVTQYRGFQWRFHPQACPSVGRDELGPNRFAATAATSWWRNEINDGWLNSQGLTCDFIEEDRNEDDWYSALGESRSFEKRLYRYDENGECLNLPNGEFTPEDKPFRLTLTNLGPLTIENDDDDDDNDGPLIEFEWKIEFNGWERAQVDTVPVDLFPTLIDGIAIGYTNTRYFKTLKLKRIG